MREEKLQIILPPSKKWRWMMTLEEMKNVDVRTARREDLVDIRKTGRGEDGRVAQERIPTYKKVTLTVKEAAEYSNIGVNRLETLLKAPRCPFVLYVGNKKLVKRKEFERFLSDSIQL